jgi:hypothetical protein
MLVPNAAPVPLASRRASAARPPAGLWARVIQRLLALNAVIWFSWQIGAPVKRSLIAAAVRTMRRRMLGGRCRRLDSGLHGRVHRCGRGRLQGGSSVRSGRADPGLEHVSPIPTGPARRIHRDSSGTSRRLRPIPRTAGMARQPGTPRQPPTPPPPPPPRPLVSLASLALTNSI